MSTDTITTSAPRLGNVDFTTNCCARQLLHQTAMPSTITTLPPDPPSVNRSPVRTSVSGIARNDADVAAPEVGAAVEGGVDVDAGGAAHADTRSARRGAKIAARITPMVPACVREAD